MDQKTRREEKDTRKDRVLSKVFLGGNHVQVYRRPNNRHMARSNNSSNSDVK